MAASQPTFAGEERLQLYMVLASTGHRGRVDARGRPPGGAPGLTRTSGQPAGVPSRDRRGTPPSASWRWRPPRSRPRISEAQAPQRRRRCGSSVTKRSAGISIRMFASSPVPGATVGRGHRRGLDGPSTPLPQQRTSRVSSEVERQQAMRRAGRVGGLFAAKLRRRRPQADGGHERRRARRSVLPLPGAPGKSQISLQDDGNRFPYVCTPSPCKSAKSHKKAPGLAHRGFVGDEAAIRPKRPQWLLPHTPGCRR